MHKKSVETPSCEPGHRSSLTPPPQTEKPEGRAGPPAEEREREREREMHAKDSDFSREELRENSILALRAKAQEHSAKMLRTVPEGAGGGAGGGGGGGQDQAVAEGGRGSTGVGGAGGREEELK